jgi:hypothetical protein
MGEGDFAYLDMVTLLSQANSCRKPSNARADDKNCKPVVLMPVDAVDTIHLTENHVACGERCNYQQGLLKPTVQL